MELAKNYLTMENLKYNTIFTQRIAIVGINRHAVSETFIRAHVEMLSKGKHYLYGQGGYYASNGISITSFDDFLPKKLIQFLVKIPGLGKRVTGLRALAHYLKRNKIQVVLAEYGVVGADIAAICYQCKIPLLVYFRGYDISVYDLLDKYENAYQQMFDKVFACLIVSKKMKDKLVNMNCPPEKIFWNPSHPNPVFFSVNNMLQSQLFLSVGRFVDKKAPHLTVLAFNKVFRQLPEARLVMVGEGPLLDACRWLAKSLQVPVKFTGALPHEEVLLFFEKAFCFIQHLVVAFNGDSEGTPVSILEAGAAGLPVVATRHAGIPDVVIEGETGFLVDEGDVEAMAAAMIQLYKDRALAAKMGVQARSRIQQHFTMEKHISILSALIQSAVR